LTQIKSAPDRSLEGDILSYLKMLDLFRALS